MRVTFFLTLTIFGCAAVAVDYYSDSYDNINFMAILKNDRIFKQYLACLLDKGPCTPEGRAFRVLVPDAISTNCVKCSPKQKAIVREIGRYLTQNRPEDWAQVIEKYDPSHVKAEKFEKFLDGKE